MFAFDMDWDSDEDEQAVGCINAGISELSFSSSDEDHCTELPPWCRPLLPLPSEQSAAAIQPSKNAVHPVASQGAAINDINDNCEFTGSWDQAESVNQTCCGETPTSTAPFDSALYGGLAALDSLYIELDQVCNLTRTSSVRQRRKYAHLNAESMGVDVTRGPLTALDQLDFQNNSLIDTNLLESGQVMGRKKDLLDNQNSEQNPENAPLLDQTAELQNIPSQFDNQMNTYQPPNKKEESSYSMMTPDKDIDTKISPEQLSPCQDSGLHSSQIPHMTPIDSQDLYALPMKKVASAENEENLLQEEEKKDFGSEDGLPAGWEKHEDNDGPYYWHIKSGTITRSPPGRSGLPPCQTPPRTERRHKEDQMTRSSTSSALSEIPEVRYRNNKTVDNSYKRRSFPARSDLVESGTCGRAIRFAVRSLGWVEMAEEDLTPERSSKAVNRCIVDLSGGVGAPVKRDVLDVVGRWGDGKDLFMDLDEGSLKLVDPESLTLLNSQPIHTIRVWGVGRDNGRDFAYVARDKVSRKHMCHVFRCDTPARTIANTLRDICKKIMIERSLQQGPGKPNQEPGEGSGSVSCGRLARPTNLPTEHRRFQRPPLVTQSSFPTPMEEPKKALKAHYVGSTVVGKPSGMTILNAAIDQVICENPGPWRPVTVSVAPSTVTISDAEDGQLLSECRVRFLSFLGIGEDVKHCAFIMHTAQDQYIAHVFFCEPSSGALCKTIEAACKLRYQKCLDAHPGGVKRGKVESGQRSITAAFRSVLSNFGGRKASSTES